MNPRFSFLSRANRRRTLLFSGLALLTFSAGEVLAGSPNLRSTFPGRRIGGGTRGECTARLIAHLVPSSSVFAPGASRTVGILEGPSVNPRPLGLTFSPLRGNGSLDSARKSSQSRTVPSSGAGLTLVTVPAFQGPTVWETAYRCEDAPAPVSAGTDLDFVTTDAPPALSLLVTEAGSEDAALQRSLKELRSACGSTVDRATVAKTFGLTDVLTSDWPARLPVRCPG
ncbi:hypothetical protein NZK32_01720 [Cyanobium sp. FGCU-52]|nr:hypothetical protein [Cyanobium sp. FGCU52]